MKKKIADWFKSRINHYKALILKLKYWCPVIARDTNSDWICIFIILRHKLESIRAELYPNGENPSLDLCLQKMYAITELKCESHEQMNQIVNEAFEIIRNNYSRWYK